MAVDLARRAPAAAPPVELRTGSHQGFGRIVLDWAQAVAFEATASGRSWRIVFDREAEIDAATIGQRFRRPARRGRQRARRRPQRAAADAQGGRAGRGLRGRGRARGDRPPRARRRDGGAARQAGFATAGRCGPASPWRSPRRAPPRAQVEVPAAPIATKIRSPPRRSRCASAPPQDERGTALDFAWSRPLPAAFLIRAGYLWGVFAAPGRRAGRAAVRVRLAAARPPWSGRAGRSVGRSRRSASRCAVRWRLRPSAPGRDWRVRPRPGRRRRRRRCGSSAPSSRRACASSPGKRFVWSA